MTVKVRKWNGAWFVVAHYRGKRKTHKCDNEAEATIMAKVLSEKLNVLGHKAFRDFGKTKRPPVFGTYSTKWLKEARSTDRKETTLKLYAGAIRNHLKPAFGKLTLDEITYAHAKAMCIELQPSLSRESISQIIGVARMIMQEAEKEGLITSNPIKDLGRYFGKKKVVRPPDPFSVGELETILAVADRWIISNTASWWKVYYYFIFLSAKTGLRFGEARALQWQDFDFRKRQILVARNWPVNGSLTTPKTAKSTRRVDMSPRLTQLMQSHNKRMKAIALKEGRNNREILARHKWVFPSHTGHVPISHGWFIQSVWNRVQEKAKVRVRNWHNLRHTFATHLLMAGVNVIYVSKQLGHSRVSMTLDRYAHWIPEDAGGRGVDVLDVREK